MLSEEEKRNASQFPRIFYARHLQPGLVGYENEVILLDTDCLKKMMPSGVGKPVYINHQKVDLKTMKEKAAGYITDSFYNELDGWAWFKFLAIDDDCYQAVANGWSVSNAHLPKEWAGSGTKNNCAYTRELLDSEFTHLAIVSEPRYEGACIMTPDEFRIYQENKKAELEELQNSKSNEKGKTMFKLFKTTKQEVTTIDADTMVELENGKATSIAEMVNALEAAEREKLNKKEKMNEDDMVECGGEKMPLKELVSKYNAMMEKKNETVKDIEDEENKKMEKKNKKKAMKKNSDSEEGEDSTDDKAEEQKPEDEDGHQDELDAGKKEKKNSIDHFEELRNANLKKGESAQTYETSFDKMERGRQRYSLQS